MKKIKTIARVGLVGLAILAIALFTACPEDNTNNNGKPPTYTYNLSVDDVTKSMNKNAQTVDLKPVLTTTPKGGTIPNGAFSLTCTTCPTCDLAVDSAGVLTIPAAFGPGDEGSSEYTLTLLWTPGGIGQPATKNFKLTITRGAITIADIEVPDFTLYRKGATDAQRTIDFILYDTLDLPVTADTHRDKVTMTNAGGSGTLTVTETEGKLVISENPSLDIGTTHTVDVRASYDGTEMGGLQTITVTVAALLYDVKFFRSATAEITSLRQPVEATDPAKKPEDPNIPGWEFQGDDWYTDSAATQVYDFTTPVAGPLSLYGKYISVSTSWNANFVITIGSDPKAAVLDGEDVYIRDTTEDWEYYVLTKQGNGTWTGTVPVQRTVTQLKYNVLVVHGGNVATGYKGHKEQDLTFNWNPEMGDDATIEYTVSEWERPQTEEGELLKKPLMQTGNWALAGLFPEWTFADMARTEAYMTADPHHQSNWGPGPRAPHSQYFRFSHRETSDAAQANYWTAGSTALITQAVSAEEGVLAVGDKVTLYSWVSRYNDTVTKVELVIGAQRLEIPYERLPTGPNWRKISFVTTLTSADIVEGNVTVGISVVTKDADPTPRCLFSIDSFSFRKGEFGTSGIETAYTFEVTDIAMEKGETKPINYALAEDGGSAITTAVINYTCNTCATCELTIAAGSITAPAGAADKVHNYTATASLSGAAIATTGFKVVVGSPVTEYNLPVEITVTAEMFDGEVVWIAGSFFGDNWGNSNGLIKLTKGAGDKWTGTVSGIAIANVNLKYNIHIGNDAGMNWSIKAFDIEGGKTLSNAPTVGKLEDTVTEWLGRPIIIEGNMLLENSFEEGATGSWLLTELTAWNFEGLSVGLDEVWIKGDGQFGAYFSDFGWDGAANANMVGAGNTLKITQDVPAADNQLSKGAIVTLSAWINQSVAGQSDVKLLVGAQEFDVTSTLTGGWQQIAHTFIIGDSDVVADKVKVGLQYTVTAAETVTFVDEFVFEFAKNLLSENSFEEGAKNDWQLTELTAWHFEGLLPALSGVWLQADGHFNVYFSDVGWYGGGSNSLLGAGGTLKITQDVSAADNELSAGTKVVLSVWINQVAVGQSGVKLIVGAQQFDVTSTLTGTAGYQQLAHTFTLTGADIVGDKVKVGLQYTADTADVETHVDEFLFAIAR